MKRLILCSAALFITTACANSSAVKQPLMNLPFVMSQDQAVELQRPRVPNTHMIKWSPNKRLHESIVVDYVSGMSQRNYLLEEPSQRLYRPMLGWALERTDLGAKTNRAARYGLQVEFSDLQSQSFGASFAGKSTAIYRVVDRRNGQAVYENQISSNFVGIYPRLNEDDASKAYDISAPGVLGAQSAFGKYLIGEGLVVETINNNDKLTDFFGGPISEASQATWDDVYQSYFWVTGISAVAGPATILAEQINPLNYISLNLDADDSPRRGAKARKGALSTSGMASRNANERAQQVNAQILAQSISYFLMDLSSQEGVEFTYFMPCSDNSEVLAETHALMAAGKKVVTDNCLDYIDNDKSKGLGIATWE